MEPWGSHNIFPFPIPVLYCDRKAESRVGHNQDAALRLKIESCSIVANMGALYSRTIGDDNCVILGTYLN